MVFDISTITDPKIKRFKELVWEKNHNNKLHCNGFIHIDFAPREMPSSEQLEETCFLITNKEDNAKGMFRLLKIQPVRADLMPATAIAASHGTSDTVFFDALFAGYSGKFSWSTPLAIYYYLRIIPG